MAFLNREQILAAQDLTVIQVDASEWGQPGDVVGVRVMTGRELESFYHQVAGMTDETLFLQRTHVAALTLCDEQGGRLFSHNEVEALAEKNGAVLDRVYEAACQLNLLRDRDREAAKKNSMPLVASGSPLPDSSAGEL